MVIAAALEFTFVNSFLEEFFWRIYLYRELAGKTEEDCSDSILLAKTRSYDGMDEETGLKVENTRNPRGGNNNGRGGNTERITIDLNQRDDDDDDSDFTRFGAGISLFGLPVSETPKILMSAYYASYHVVILLCFVQWWLALIGFLGLVFLGRIFVYCRENEVRL
jgi:hypothetical protein